MAKNQSKSSSEPAGLPSGPNLDPFPAPAPAPIAGARFDREDTWMTFGLGLDGEEEDRTVTVVFNRFEEESSESTDPFPGGPLSPVFPRRP